jgi:hypothetical protein
VACRRWHRAGGRCGWWWRRFSEEEGVGTGHVASVCSRESDGRVGLGNVGAEWCVQA